MKRVGIVGFPIEHSLSPAMHNAAFKALGMDEEWLYDAMAIPPDIADYAVNEPRRHGYIGLNVTIPFKQNALQWGLADEKARAIGAVNTLDFRDDTATNTDVDGFMDDLKAHDVAIEGQKVIILGAGGAARAAVYGLWQNGAEIIVVNRTLERAQDMLQQLRTSAGIQDIKALSLEEAARSDINLIVNATSAGMFPKIDNSPWNEDVPFPENVTVYDMVYTPAQTKLMRQAESVGGRAISGLGMLVRQGAVAFKLWTGVEPPIDVMMETVREALKRREAKG
jgi:shikimate dehydrogenase